MKKTVLLLLFVFISLSSCKKKDLDVNFSTNLSSTSEQIEVNTTTRNVMTGSPFDTSFVLNLDNSDTHEYLDQLKSIDLSNVNLTFDGLAGLAGNTTVVDLTITFDNDIVINIPNFSFDQVAQGDPIMITDTQKIQQAADRLLNNKKVNITVTGTIPSNDAFQFYITVSAKANIKAGAL